MATVGAAANEQNLQAEAAAATEKFNEHRAQGENAQKGIREQVERIMRLIRDTRRQNGEFSLRYRMQVKTQMETRQTAEIVRETIRSVVFAFPARFLSDKDGQDELDRLEIAVSALIDETEKANKDLAKTKDQLSGMTDETSQIRKETEEMRRAVEDAICQLRDLIGAKDANLTLIELITAMKKRIDSEKHAKRDIEKVLQGEKKLMDDLLEKRRNLLAIAKQLFDQCVKVDKFAGGIGLKSTASCPAQIDENKSLAAEFERALSWLIGQVALVIRELQSTKRRLADAEERLKKNVSDAKDAAEQLEKRKKAIEEMKQKLEELKAKLKEQQKLNARDKKKMNDLQKQHDEEVHKAMTAHEAEASRWQQLSTEYDEKSKRTREELKSFSKDASRLRDEVSKLAGRIDQSLSEYQRLNGNLEGKKGVVEKVRSITDTIQKWKMELIALQTEAKNADREAGTCSTEIDAANKELERRAQRLQGENARLDHARGQREKDDQDLHRLRDEEKMLMEKIQSNEKALENRKQRHGQISHLVEGLERRLRELERENQDLLWERDEEYPQSAASEEKRPCEVCISNEKMAGLIPQLQRELEQLEKERANLQEREKQVREEVEGLQDDRVVRKTKIDILGRKSSTQSSRRSSSQQARSVPSRAHKRTSASAETAQRKQMVKRGIGGAVLAGSGSRLFKTNLGQMVVDGERQSCNEVAVLVNTQVFVCGSSSVSECTRISTVAHTSSSASGSSHTASEEGYDAEHEGGSR